jgi:putative transposase
VWTCRGLVDIFVLFFLQMGSRKVFLAGVTAHPNRACVLQQARNFVLHADGQPDKPEYLLRDYDTKFVPEFDAVLESEGITVKKVGPLASNMNAWAERWIQSVRRESLDHFLVFGEDHLRHLVSEYFAYYNGQRLHQGVGNWLLSGEPPPEGSAPVPAVVFEERLGGLLRRYRCQAV